MSNQYEVQRLLDQLDRVDNVTSDLNELADRSRWDGKWTKAHKYCEESLNLARAFNDARSEGISLLHGWAVHVLQKDFEKAIDFCHRSRQAFDRVVDSYGQVLAMFSLGITYQEWEVDGHDPTKLREALRIYGQALEVVCELKERFDFSGNVEKAGVCQRLITEMRERFHAVATLYARSPIGEEKREPSPQREPRKGDVVGEVSPELPRLRLVPICGDSAAAGDALTVRDNIMGYLSANEFQVERETLTLQVIQGTSNEPHVRIISFAMKVTGESMKPTIQDGEYILVTKQDRVENGEIAVVRFRRDVGTEELQATVKRYFQEKDHILLQPDNEDVKWTIFVGEKNENTVKNRYRDQLEAGKLEILVDLAPHIDGKVVGILKRKEVE